MEPNKNNNATTPAGFDLNGLLSSPGIGELIKHLLSAGGAALFNYLMSIKPMQEKMEALAKENKELREKIENVEVSQEELILQLNRKFKPKVIEDLNDDDDDYFPVRRQERKATAKKSKYLD